MKRASFPSETAKPAAACVPMPTRVCLRVHPYRFSENGKRFVLDSDSLRILRGQIDSCQSFKVDCNRFNCMLLYFQLHKRHVFHMKVGRFRVFASRGLARVPQQMEVGGSSPLTDTVRIKLSSCDVALPNGGKAAAYSGRTKTKRWQTYH